MDDNLVEFLRRFDVAIKMAEEARAQVRPDRDSWQLEYYQLLITNLRGYRQSVVEGRLGRVSRGEVQPGTGFGMGMWLGEWCENDDVLGACSEVENYFRYEF
ncbi:hypothetical protein G3545_08690 [Starkeya sp. ORNL1]|uniref:hypothetical protein n=1 Tax=Starkeya sp. ORNL1 TaxID=2709380 RepID=UPI001462CF43|nr:hypothetical protein [Starkeya sp. ORNL1]QJP13728.1 hypothetical protein G3545_08690 [Starkeya sp. ORNL1]